MNAPFPIHANRSLLDSYGALKAAEAARDSYQRDGNDTAAQRWDERHFDITASMIEQIVAVTGLSPDQIRDVLC